MTFYCCYDNCESSGLSSEVQPVSLSFPIGVLLSDSSMLFSDFSEIEQTCGKAEINFQKGQNLYFIITLKFINSYVNKDM